jgi:hypothetical protein
LRIVARNAREPTILSNHLFNGDEAVSFAEPGRS